MTRLLFWVPVAAVSCGVGSIDLAGKECPCIDGWACDTATNTCVPDTPTSAVPAGTDVAPPPAPPGGVIDVRDLRADWVTPNTIRWSWAVTGNAADFQRYELVTGPTQAVVESHMGAKPWGALNPELSEFHPRIGEPPNGEFRVWTITQEHTPGSLTWAKVTAIDKSGRGQSTAAAAKTAPEATDVFTIFQDSALPGSPEPNAEQFSRVNKGAFGTSSHCYLFTPKCADGESSCSDTFGQYDLARTITTLSQAEFDRAFVELQMRASALTPGAYVQFSLQFGPPACGAAECRYRHGGLGLKPNDTYRVFQLPLRKLVRNNDPRELTLDVLKQRAFKLHGVFWQSRWSANAQVRIDEIKIRW